MWGKKNTQASFHCGNELFWELNIRLNGVSALVYMEDKCKIWQPQTIIF